LRAGADLVVVAVPLALGLATLAQRAAPPDYTLVQRFSRDRLLEGESVTVEVEVTARSTIPLMELLDPLTEAGTVIAGKPRAVLAIPRGETVPWGYEIRSPIRGLHDPGMVIAPVHDRAGAPPDG